MDKKEAMTKLENGLQSLLQSDNWRSYLNVQKYFHAYSWNNTMLIWAQMPTASQVAGFQSWKKLGRFVKKGEKGISILAPMIVKKKEKNTDDGGDKVLAGFKVVHVFDVSQTDGEPLPEMEVIHRLQGDSDAYQRMLAVCPFPVQENEDLNGANGIMHHVTATISVLSSLSNVHKAKTLAHEWAHGLLHGNDEGRKLSHEVKELEAESTAFIVCDALGFDTSEYSFGYLASWTGEDAVETLHQSATRIQKTADLILQALQPAAEKSSKAVAS